MDVSGAGGPLAKSIITQNVVNSRKMKKERYRIEKAIAAVIEERGLTAKDVSEGAGVTYYRVQWGIIERRKGWRPKPEDIEKICAFLRVDPMQLRKTE